tara:strand:- start:18559 stop:19911 length:1353 start_codon:yes stop_codon:yes gene_type:complete
MSFEPRSVTAFRYAAARFDAATAVAEFDFELIGEGEPLRFTESITFTTGPAAPVLSAEDAERLQRVLALLGAVLGLSYFKAAAPPRVELDVAGLTAEAVEYLRQVLRHGLAEFAYRAGLPSLLDPDIVAADLAPALPIRDAEGTPFVPIGGGKDSVVSVESLRAVGLEPVQFAVNPNAIITRVAEASELPLIAARRRLDPALLDLNARGALNGHVPVTAMNTLIAVAQSLLLGLGPVVMSNESSASDPTLEWDGESVNHQWSKSLEAERLLSAVLEPQAGLRGASFSLLRPFSELRIARGFAATTRYDAAIVSCNRAFRLAGATPTWCGECDKCRFVFLALAPHLEPERLLGIIGHDLFADEAQLPGFRALLGLGDHKPFECVGEEAESSVAVTLVSRMPRWADSPVIRALLAEAPELAAGDAALEEHILGESEALAVAAVYERARRALV